MYRVSEKFRQQAYSGEALYTANLSINGQSVPNEQIASIVISDPIIDTSTEVFYLGSFIAKQLTIKFKNLDGLTIESGLNVSLEIGQEIDGEYEYVPIGQFLIDDLDENYYTTCEINCLDYSVLFKPNVDYSPVFNDGTATIDEILRWICNHFGVELGNYPSINGNVEIGTYDGTISGKQWISYIAEIKGCNAKIDREGVLQFIPFNNTSNVSINALESEEWELGEKYKISQIVYFDPIRNYTYGDETANTLYIRQDNPFVTDSTVIENIYEKIFVTSKEKSGETIVINDGSSAHRGKLTIYGNTYQKVEEGSGGLSTNGLEIHVNNVDPEKTSYLTLQGNTYQNSTTGKNLFDANKVINNANINSSGTIVSDNYKIYYVKVQSNNTYTMSIGQNRQWVYAFYEEIPQINSSGTSRIVNTSINETFIVPNNYNYIALRGISDVNEPITNLQLEQGSTATDYEPFTNGESPNPEYPQEIQKATGLNTINIHGKNYFGINFEGTTAGINFNSLNGTVTLDGTTTGSGNIYNNTANKITLRAGTYVISSQLLSGSFERNGKDTAIYVRTINGNVALLSTTGSLNYTVSNRFTLDEDTDIYVQIFTNGAGYIATNLKVCIQIEKGETPTEFEPYFKDEYEVDLGNIELCQLGNYKDYFYKESNKWYLHKEINSMTLNGSEQWGKNSTRFSLVLTGYDNGAKPILCTHFIPTDDFGYHNTHNYTIIFFRDEQWANARLSINDSDFSTTNDFKNWLSTNNVIAYFPLATSTNTEITDTTLIEQLNNLYNAQLYENIQIDSNTSNLQPYINLIYNVVVQTPSIEKPSEIHNVTGLITITNRNTVNEEDEDYSIEEYELDLGNIELLNLGNIQDRIYLENNRWYYTNYFTKINSYNGEEVGDIYISSTGGLDTGATVYYYSGENQPVEIPTEEMYQQLNAINNIIIYDNDNIIETNTNNQKPFLKLFYYLPIDFYLYSLKNKNYGDISLDSYDVIDFTLDNNEHYFAYNNNTTTYEMNISTYIDCQIPSKQKEVTTNIIGGDMPTKVKMLRTRLNYVDNEIEMLVEEQTEQDKKINQTIMDINSTRNIFQITGGSNLIKNSQFLYNDPEIEEGGITHRTFWDFTDNGNLPYNNLGDGYDPTLIGQTVSLAKIQIRDTILSSRITNISDLQINKLYTLNYSYKQDELTTTRIQLLDENGNTVKYIVTDEETGVITLNDIDITYDEETERITSETFQFEAPTSSLILKITTSTTSGTDGYFYLYDLMLNSGDKKSWELASSEIYSTTIQMSNLGLQVITSDEDIATLLTSQGFQVIEYNDGRYGAIITQFTKDGIITKDLKSSSVHTGKYIMTEIMMSNVEHHIEYFEE